MSPLINTKGAEMSAMANRSKRDQQRQEKQHPHGAGVEAVEQADGQCEQWKTQFPSR